ncbi:NAD(P)-dependent oxidoreductase [Hyphococcus flavus]|uniref:NAD(P)-dependent oxidoreductase n=1 Tax=Hyphococcus flavus TaxID=1866326 RepID=A0AAE9ZGQ4_9PROT|nr:NAD(P)-dependent oxidoreductase [Hyphococcus flavus]WDI32703.1 NAD(P)-dependent oxidoreductase [Hyphococcus flavus]
MTKHAAVTGGTGFVGAALINKLIDGGWRVTALARDPSRLTHATEINAVSGSLDDEGALAQTAASADVFFHLAGVTHARNREQYENVNVHGATLAAQAARNAGARFVHASSMSAQAPEVSPYAQSKFDSEKAVADVGGDWLALRLPAIYGPRDRATLPYFKLVKSGFALEPKTARPARASILYVDDAANALIDAAQADLKAGVFEVGDECDDGWSWAEIGQILGDAFGRKPRAIRVPRPFIAGYHRLLRTVEGIAGKTPSVREGQINEFFHETWVARENLLSDACNWRPKTPLKEGFAKTIRWYQEHDLL